MKPLLLVVVALAAGLGVALPFTVAPDTTHILQPLDPTGVPDFIAAINTAYAADEADNAALLLKTDAVKLTPLDPALEPKVSHVELHAWKSAEFPGVARWLEANSAALDRVAQASRRSRWFLPLRDTAKPADVFDSAYSLMPLMSGGPRELVIRANLARSERRLDDALRHLEAAARLSFLLTDTAPAGLERLLGLAGFRLVHSAVADMPNDGWSREELDRIRRWHAALPVPTVEAAVKSIDGTERLTQLKMLTGLATGRTSPDDSILYLTGMAAKFGDASATGRAERIRARLAAGVLQHVDWNRALRVTNHQFDELIILARAAAASDRIAAEQRQKQNMARSRAVLDADASADVDPTDWLIHVFNQGPDWVTLERLLLMHDTDRALRLLADTSLALALHRTAHGRYPDSLAQLNPVPAPDPFTNQPLIYTRDAAGFTLSSAGESPTDPAARLTVRISR